MVVTVVVTPLMGCPAATGSVQLKVDNSSLGSPIALDANGNATISIPDPTHNIPGPVTVFPSIGNHTVGVDYGGGVGNFAYPAQGANFNQISTTVNKAGSITNLTAATNGTSLTAAVSAAPPGSGSPTGSVQFFNGSTSLGSANVSGGQATIPVSGPLVGTFAASYSGDANFTGSNATPLRIGPPTTSALSISADVNPSTIGQSVTFTATLTVANGDGPPSGTIQFAMDGTKIPGSPAQVSGGQASFTTSSLAVGSHTISASYSGDFQYPAVSVNRGQVVNPIGSVLTLTSSPTAPQSGQAVTLTAKIGPQPPAGIPGPTGLVTFSEGSTQLGAPAPVVAGGATLTLSTLTTGVHQIVAVYGGDADWSSAHSNTLAVAVNVNVNPLTITTTSLPDALAGVAYTAPPMTATGGLPPLQWSIVQTAPSASGIVLASDGTFSGTPKNAGQFTLTVQVSDAQNTKVNKQFTLQVVSLLITTQTLPGGITGSPYAASVAVTGGTQPYTFSGTLPPNLTIDPASGAISGTPTVNGTVAITVNVKDSTSPPATASKTYNVVFALPAVPPVTIGGSGNTGPGQQPAIQLNLGANFPVAISGTLTLTFAAANGGGDNPEVQFAAGGRTLAFTIPANTSAATFTVSSSQLQTGTVAGKITITAHLKAGGGDITPSPVPTQVITISAAPPTISCTASRTATGFTVVCTGFSDTLDMTNATFQFSGANLATTSLTIPVGTLFSTYYQSATPGATGSQFVYTQPFTVTGSTAAVTSVSVTMANSNGTSQAATATIQ